MNQKLAKAIDSLALAIGIFLFFGIMVFPNMRDVLGIYMNYILGGLPAILPFPIVIFILAAITGLYASLIQKYTMDWDFLRGQQEKMKRLQREMKEAQLSGDNARLQKLQTEQMKMVSEQGKMMQMQFKPMLYIGIISIPLFMWAVWHLSPNLSGLSLPVVNFPFWGKQVVTHTLIGPIAYWYYWYFVCSLPISQIIRKALNIGSMS